MPEKFIWLADDCMPYDGWLDNLIECWDSNIKDNLGLVVCNDKNTMHGGAAFAMTSSRWLYVLFGMRFFPTAFRHYFLDTLLADRSKDLGRYYFCKNSIVEHLHWSIGKSDGDVVYKKTMKSKEQDKKYKDQYDYEWRHGEREKAEKRMEKEMKKYE